MGLQRLEVRARPRVLSGGVRRIPFFPVGDGEGGEDGVIRRGGRFIANRYKASWKEFKEDEEGHKVIDNLSSRWDSCQLPLMAILHRQEFLMANLNKNATVPDGKTCAAHRTISCGKPWFHMLSWVPDFLVVLVQTCGP